MADVFATALDMLRMYLAYPIFGRSILKTPRDSYILMHFNDVTGFRRGDQVAVLRPEKPAETLLYQNGRLLETVENPELEKDGLSLIHVIEDLYERRAYR